MEKEVLKSYKQSGEILDVPLSLSAGSVKFVYIIGIFLYTLVLLL